MAWEYIEDNLYKDAIKSESYKFNSGSTIKGEKEKKKTFKEEIKDMRSELNKIKSHHGK